MTWFRVGGAGIPAALKNAMNAVFNKKFGTSGQNYPPKQWPDEVNLLGPLPEGTATGSIATFSDGADEVPIKSWEVGISPTLTGKSAIECTQTGKNLLDTAISETKTHNSVSITCDGNGKYTATGTATGGSANITFTLKTPCTIKSGMYLHIMNSGASGSVSITLQKQDNTTIYAPALSPANRIADLSSYEGQTIYSILFYIANGASFEMTLTPMVCFSNTATTYEPYTAPTVTTVNLGRTIYGGEVDIVNGVGKDNFASILISETSWTYDSANARFISANLTGMKNVVIRTLHVMAYGYETIDDARPIGNVPDQAIYNANYERKVIIHDSNYTNVSDFLTAKGNISIIYPLATPTDFTFTGQEIPTRLGYNALWADEGDTEVTYRADISLALQAVSGSRGLMMASRPVTQLIGEESDPDQVNELVENDETEQEGEDNAR